MSIVFHFWMRVIKCFFAAYSRCIQSMFVQKYTFQGRVIDMQIEDPGGPVSLAGRKKENLLFSPTKERRAAGYEK